MKFRRTVATAAALASGVAGALVATSAAFAAGPVSSVPAAFEVAVPSGTYNVTVSVGEATYTDSVHRILVEGTVAIAGFTPSASAMFASATVKVSVTDGRLTIAPTGGQNTKIEYVTATSTTKSKNTYKFDFGPIGSTVPSGYTLDYGQPYGAHGGLTYGWVAAGTTTPLDIQGNADIRTSTTVTDTRLLGFIHMQLPPAAPSSLSTSAGDGQVVLTWPASTSTVTGYVVLRDGVAVASPSGTTYTDAGLVNGTSHSWCVRSVETTTRSTACSPTATATPQSAQAPAPTAPTGLSATAGDTAATLAWTPVSGATGYTVLRDGVAVGTTGVASFTDTGLVDGTTYTYAVTATNATGTSPASGSVTVTPVAPMIAPAAPTGLVAVAGDGSAVLTWNASAGATAYQVSRGGTVVATTSGTTVTDTGLTNGTTYTWTVVAVGTSGSSSPSACATATPMPPVPATPTGLTAQAGSTSVALTWTAVTGATSYTVLRNGTAVAAPTTNAFTDTGLTNGAQYSYAVSATNTAGTSAPSAAVTATPMPAVPAAPTGLVAVPGNATVALSWTAVSGATSYTVLRGGVAVGSPTTNGYTDSGLTNGTAYSYTVTAANMAGTSSPSATVTATPSAPAATGPLPFALPGTSTLRASAHKVFAHYFTPYPVSLDNAKAKALGGTGDYYDNGYLSPTGENGIHASYGGLLRDRPIPRAPLTVTDYRSADLLTEINQAKSAGLDGFTVDLMSAFSSTDSNSLQAQRLLTQADAAGSFDIVLMPDMTSSMKSLTPAALATSVSQYAAHSSAYRLSDGRLVLSPFAAENWSVATWQAFFTALAGYTDPVTGKPYAVALMPCFLNFGAYYSTFAPISIGFGNWGDRSPGTNSQSSLTSYATKTHGTTCVNAVPCIWMQPVSIQDERPNQYKYNEAANTQNLRATWNGAITAGADWVQEVTWNDYSEGTQFAPSANNGWTFLDISAYYLTRFKTGTWPTLTGDAVYTTNRIQPYAALPTYAETNLMVLNTSAAGYTPSQDYAEALVMLSAPATVTVTLGTTTQTFSDPAGVTAHAVPLTTGTFAVTVVRSGATVASVTSKAVVTTSPYVQDESYHGTDSRR